MGGQPGAGKETIYGIFNEKSSNNIVRVNCDDFRPYHPHYFELNAKYGANDKLYNDEFVGRISRKLLSELSDKHYSFIFESTLRTPNVALSINKDIKPKGYKTILCIMATPKEVSWQGVVDRYNEQLANEMEGCGEAIIQAMKTGMFSVCAHPDRIFRYAGNWNEKMSELSERIIRSAAENNVVLEKNLSSFIYDGYFRPEFWKLVPKSQKVIIGLDAHKITGLNPEFCVNAKQCILKT